MLGGGCNSLFPDKGIDGLVIKMQKYRIQARGRWKIYYWRRGGAVAFWRR